MASDRQSAASAIGAIYTLAAALSGGIRAGLVAAFGCTLGIVPHMVAAISGTAALFHASDFAFVVLKFAGVGYLLFMAWTMLRSRSALLVSKKNGPLDDQAVVRKAIVLNLLNPNLPIFFLCFLPQFVEAGEAASGPL